MHRNSTYKRSGDKHGEDDAKNNQTQRLRGGTQTNNLVATEQQKHKKTTAKHNNQKKIGIRAKWSMTHT